MSPGQKAYESLRMERAWSELSDDERATWELGASLQPVGGVLNLEQDSNSKVA